MESKSVSYFYDKQKINKRLSTKKLILEYLVYFILILYKQK